MKLKLHKILALATLGLTAYSGAASAQQTTQPTDPGWYFGINAGYNKLSDSDNHLSGTTTTTPTPTTSQVLNVLGLGLVGNDALLVDSGTSLDQLCQLSLLGQSLGGLLCSTVTSGGGGGGGGGTAATDFTTTFKAGFAAGLTTGYSFNNGLRPELAVTYRKNDYNTVSSSGSATTSADGSRTSISGMGNLWFDFLDKDSTLRPYIGGGAGVNNVKLSGSGSSASKTVFAWQAGAGLNFLLSKKDTLSLDYRYLASNNVKIDVGASQKIETDYKAHTIMLGYRHYLGGETGPTVNPKCPTFPAGVALGSDGCPLDSDGDGVPDYLDKCPGTPKGVTVDANGCPNADSDGDGIPDYLDKCPNTPPGVVVDSNGCPVDSDGDGVPDFKDKCPNTPKGVQVNADGCPLDSDGDGVPDYLDKCPGTPRGTPVNADGCPFTDSDGDGIPDYLDKCPNTPKGQKVGPDGCPLDSDGDGIPDDQDECPNTPAGAKVLPNGCALKGDCRKPRPGEQVDEHGCALEHNFILKGVKFEFDSDRLTPAAKVILDQVSETLKAYPEVSVEVQGHTDYIGTDAYNLGLSEKRAIAVKVYLGARGVELKRLTPVGYGKTRPIDTNETEAGRENNRRVELKVQD